MGAFGPYATEELVLTLGWVTDSVTPFPVDLLHELSQVGPSL